ncbi:hypothetical protein SLEP1_g16430 [Rubroshorea leprosula]|uniref:Uncharacterized protein n=1 Tax=Rubroshorea leprosula TaxID=152421 RepID=A0AAV5IZN9_9ROSI|nr:hypothetical protein SLEP1_g16430 [Rubroshorea leprosula]
MTVDSANRKEFVIRSSSGGNNSGEDFKEGDKEEQRISVDHLHKLNPKNVSAWNMKRLMNIIGHGALSTLDEAKIAAKKIFQNDAKPGSKYVYLKDISRFMRCDEASKTMSLFEGGSESKKISKSTLKNWVANAFRERRALALTLNDTKTAVNRLHQVVNVLVGIIMLVIWLVILGIATSKFLLFVSSQFLVLGFVFGNTLKQYLSDYLPINCVSIVFISETN